MADKIIIKKKSGVGEITGVTEIEISDIYNTGINSSTFNELQFTESGEYVLSISTTVPNVDPIELKIIVDKDTNFIKQEENKVSKSDTPKTNTNRPIISQLDKPTIKLPPIEMDVDINGGDQSQYIEGLGYTPLIWYRTIAIEERYIRSLRLYHNDILPMIEFTFEDTKDIMKGIATPTDDSSIELFLNSTSKNLKSLHMSFKIESFVQGEQKGSQTYKVRGVINVPDLYIPNSKSYNNTSFGTLRTISKELGLGFNSNISDTDDKMPWRNSNKKFISFMNDIITRSYISDNSFMIGYIDYYYCFNYVDIGKEMERDASNDVGVDTSPLIGQSKKNDMDRIIPIKLINDHSQSGSCNFIKVNSMINDSTRKSLKEGYSTITKIYDRSKKQFLVFNVDSTTSDGKDSIILKGAIDDDKYVKDNVKHIFNGKVDTDNVHKNYNYSATQNRINLANLNKIALDVSLPNANWNLYKFQKVDVQIINQTSTPSNPDMIDWRYSGYYIIADIEYLWDGNKMTQRLRLVRKELGKTPDEIENDVVAPKKTELKENNINPVDIKYKPNSVYDVGRSYFVKDKSGNRYELIVRSLSENGDEITAELKKK